MRHAAYMQLIDPYYDSTFEISDLEISLEDTQLIAKHEVDSLILASQFDNIKQAISQFERGQEYLSQAELFAFLKDKSIEFYGTENLELTEAIVNFIKRMFSMIYEFIDKILSTIGRLINNLIRIDFRMKRAADNVYIQFQDKYTHSTADINASAQEKFKKSIIRQMCPKKVFIQMLDDFKSLCEALTSGVQDSISRDIDKISKDLKTEDIPWMNNHLVSVIDSLGITLTKNNSSKYVSPFQNYQEASLESLDYKSFEELIQLNDLYTKEAWPAYLQFTKLEKKIEDHRRKLTRKESELMNNSEISKTVLSDQVQFIRKQLTLITSLFAGAKQIHTSIGYRRKRIIELALQAFNNSAND